MRLNYRSVALLLGGLLIVALSLVFLGREEPPLPSAAPKLQPLTDAGDLIGEWNRVDFPEAVVPINWRKFTATGQYQVRYGDIVENGSYTFIDANTIQTGLRFGAPQWTVGWEGEKLVLTNQATRAVEKYVRVPPGTLQ